MTDDTQMLIQFMNDAADYFERRPTGGEDAAHWANTYNAENCRKAATALSASLAREEVLRKVLEADCTRFPAMEAKLIEVANRISGMRGQPPCHPDPVMLSEWVAEINRAALQEQANEQ